MVLYLVAKMLAVVTVDTHHGYQFIKYKGMSLRTSTGTTVLTIDASSRAIVKNIAVTNDHNNTVQIDNRDYVIALLLQLMKFYHMICSS
jgi:hypothetical protein